MKLNIQLCSIAKVVLLLSVLGVALDVYVFSTTILGLSLNVILTILFVSIANWSCYNKGRIWIAWVIAILSAFSVIAILIIIKYRYTSFEVSRAIEQEKDLRQHLGI
jgi:hypothetical protein